MLLHHCSYRRRFRIRSTKHVCPIAASSASGPLCRLTNHIHPHPDFQGRNQASQNPLCYKREVTSSSCALPCSKFCRSEAIQRLYIYRQATSQSGLARASMRSFTIAHGNDILAQSRRSQQDDCSFLLISTRMCGVVTFGARCD